MSVKAMLTIDLNHNVTGEQRETFYKELLSRQWKKIDSLTTTWSASFKDGVSTESAVNEAKNDVAAAAAVAKIAAYDAAVMLGPESPVIWKK